MMNQYGERGPARSMELLWEAGERQSRGPKPGLKLDQIVEAAIKVADAEGVAGVSMRKVAAELGVGTMSLYRYVPGKAELLDLMLDRLSDPTETIKKSEGLDWLGACEVMAHGTYALYTDHPWLLQINWSRPVLGPNSLAGVEFVVSRLAGLGLTDHERIMVLTTIDAYCVGSARSYVQYTTAAQETGVSDEEFWSAQLPMLERAMASGEFPAMAALAEDVFETGWEDSFEFGLQRLLDGLRTFVAQRQTT